MMCNGSQFVHVEREIEEEREPLQNSSEAHLNAYRFEDIVPGLTHSFFVDVTDEMMDGFLSQTHDINPLHTDEAFACGRGFHGRVVYGMLTASFLSTLAGVYLPGKYSLIHSVQVEFPNPVFVGDTLNVSGSVTEIDERFRIFTMKITIKNQNGKKVCRGKMRIGVSE